MEITVKITRQYGVEVIKPVCAQALTFAAIAGTKNLTSQAIAHIKSLGYAVRVVQLPDYL